MEKKQYDIFISYSSKDSDIAFMLCEALENEGISCWIAPRDVEAGHYAASIVEGIESSKLFVLLFSQNSNDSTPVLNELDMAMGNKLLIIPARIEEVLPSKAMKFYLMATHWFDVLEPKTVKDFDKFIETIKKNLGVNENVFIKNTKPLKIKKKGNLLSLKNILTFISFLIITVPLLYLFLSDETQKTTKILVSEKNITTKVLSQKLLKEIEEKEHWKEEYFKLKEKYRDNVELTVQAEKIQDTQGYKKAVSFYMSIKEDAFEKEKIEVETKEVNRPIDNAMILDKDMEEDVSTDIMEDVDNSQEIEEFINAKKYALVIGFDKYEDSKIPLLKGSVNDARFFAENLINNNFDVQTLHNSYKNEIINSLKNLNKKARNGDNVYIFFSGYGSSINLTNQNIFANNNLMKYLENGLIIPSNFDYSKPSETVISMKRDIFPIIHQLDKKNVKVVIFSDVSFNRKNKYRSTDDVHSKFLQLHSNLKVEKYSSKSYKNLMFFGTKHSNWNQKTNRGVFSTSIIYCLNNADTNNDLLINHREFKECLATEHSFFNYSIQNDNFILAQIKNRNKDTINIKSNTQFNNKIESFITHTRDNYDIEIVDNGDVYELFKYTGLHYATVEKKDLEKYLLGYRIFTLSNKNKLLIKIISEVTKEEERVFCNNERLSINIENNKRIPYLVVLSLDHKGKLIVITPDPKRLNKIFPMEIMVTPPFGIDKLKVFQLKSKSQFDKILTLARKFPKDGILSTGAIEELYDILILDRSFREQEADIFTIARDIDICRKEEF